MMQVEYRLFAHYADIAGPFHMRPAGKMIGGKWVWTQGPLADFHALVAELLNNPRLNRKLVKNVNFAKIYGAGIIKFAFMIGMITEKQYKELSTRRDAHDRSVWKDPLLDGAYGVNRAYETMFPGVKPLLDLARSTSENRGYVCDYLGRRARIISRHNSALNRVIQGGAATYNKEVLVEVYKIRKYLGLRMEITMHDELGGNLADPVWGVPAMKRVLNHQYRDFKAPILWDIKTGANWAECK
jgi:DNA polymerase I-like protein with 3'-5' exonuclease and polymerase domains